MDHPQTPVGDEPKQTLLQYVQLGKLRKSVLSTVVFKGQAVWSILTESGGVCAHALYTLVWSSSVDTDI